MTTAALARRMQREATRKQVARYALLHRERDLETLSAHDALPEPSLRAKGVHCLVRREVAGGLTLMAVLESEKEAQAILQQLLLQDATSPSDAALYGG